MGWHGKGGREVLGVVCPHAPPFHANGKGEARGGVPSRAPFLHVHGGTAKQGRGEAGNNRERGQRVPHAPSHVYGVPRPRGKARGGVPSYRVARSRGKGRGRWQQGEGRGAHLGGVKREWEGAGATWRGVPSCATLPCEWGADEGPGGRVAVGIERRGKEEGKGEGLTLWWKQNVPATIGWIARQPASPPIACHQILYSGSGVQRVQGPPSSHPRRPPISATLPICKRGRPTSPSPTSRTTPTVNVDLDQNHPIW
ncbi:hypothetical protein EDB85DRAFT_1893465 [Lactarius pseudohatsudake]|nr:hypothetical protein EDB85DRAFT_1893465 [Lactarius pseudohatsudake]